ncbi:MAG: cysteine desulfurase family protein [Patescibacteria group bacterium]
MYMSSNGKESKRIYLDYAATTPVDARVAKAMKRYESQDFGNPSSIHEEGVVAKKAMESARKKVAALFSAHGDEIVFTSGGTESNNLAILGFLQALLASGRPLHKCHAITSVIEHSSVLECFRELEKKGVVVDYAPVTDKGIVDLKAFKKLLRPTTALVSIQYANNEIGTIQPIRDIAKLIRHYKKNTDDRTQTSDKKIQGSRKIIFHTDASQAVQYLTMNTQMLGVDMATIDGHKMYGPKGVGALYVRRGVLLQPILFGGRQEGGLRSTTENVSAIVGLAEACEISATVRDAETKRLSVLRDYFFEQITHAVPNASINGDRDARLPNNINISILNLDAEYAVLQFDVAGIACSTKSSCLTHDSLSYVIFALDSNRERAETSLRFTLGRSTTKKEIDATVLMLKKIVGKW